MGGLAGWRDASLILLAIEFFVLGLPLAVLGYYVVRYLRIFRRWLAAHFPIWQAAAVRGRDYVEQYAGYAAIPVIGAASFASAVAAATRLRRPASGSARRPRYE